MSDKKRDIYRCANELFGKQGFKKTGVSDITKAAGIAAGTFYLYYPSKDSLFMDIFLDENRKLKEDIVAAVDLNGDPPEVIREMILLNNKGMSENPILRQWYDRDVFVRIERKYREESGIEKIDFMYGIFIDAVRKWQAEGKMRIDIGSGMIMAIFSALINIDTHKEEIGLEYFPEVMEHIADFIIKGLTENVKSDKH